jgi:hypothetical protein
MSSQQVPKKVQDVQPAPVVSIDPTSPESILARNAKTTQLQADSDSKFDTVLERFSDLNELGELDDSEELPVLEQFSHSGSHNNHTPLLAVGMTLLCVGGLLFLSRKGKK